MTVQEPAPPQTAASQFTVPDDSPGAATTSMEPSRILATSFSLALRSVRLRFSHKDGPTEPIGSRRPKEAGNPESPVNVIESRNASAYCAKAYSIRATHTRPHCPFSGVHTRNSRRGLKSNDCRNQLDVHGNFRDLHYCRHRHGGSFNGNGLE